MKRQYVLYPKAENALKAMGENLRLARRWRKIAAKMMAERANISSMTLRALERGSPHKLAACWGFGRDETKGI